MTLLLAIFISSMIIIPIKLLTKNHRYNLNRPLFHSSARMRLRVEPAMTKSRARNDGIGHPGPDPGSNSLVCADELASFPGNMLTFAR